MPNCLSYLNVWPLASGLLLALCFSASNFQASPCLPLHFPRPSKATQLVAGQHPWLCLGPISCSTDNSK